MRRQHMLRRLVGVAVAAAVAAATMLSTSSPAHATPGVYIRISNYHSLKVAHVTSTLNNLQVVQQTWADLPTDKWEMNAVGGGGFLQFKNSYSHQCLDLEPNHALDGAKVVQDVCDANNMMQWWIRIHDPVLPVWHIRHAFTGFDLSVANASTVAGAGLIQSVPSTSTAQMWQIW